MVRRTSIRATSIRAAAFVVPLALGGVCELVAFALPWARYRVEAASAQAPVQLTGDPGMSLFVAPGGTRYLGLLLALAALVAAAVTGPLRVRPACGSFAVVLGVVGAVVANQIGARAASTASGVHAIGLATVKAHGAAGTGVLFGTLGPVLLGVGALAAAWATSRDVAPAGAPTAPAG
ncbi:MAG TPA: hypothetical protein VJT31_23355 [Rugosimonospora sp.]|nr:hypothetical protein [Rugosimonospora sp.]